MGQLRSSTQDPRVSLLSLLSLQIFANFFPTEDPLIDPTVTSLLTLTFNYGSLCHNCLSIRRSLSSPVLYFDVPGIGVYRLNYYNQQVFDENSERAPLNFSRRRYPTTIIPGLCLLSKTNDGTGIQKKNL